jgi:nitronate monooxygenase
MNTTQTSNLTVAAKHFCDSVGIQFPIIGGAMYPCSNPELVAAISEAGGIGIIQPISLTYVHGHKDFRKGLQFIRTLTQKPVGLNIIVETSSAKYTQIMQDYVDIALEEGIRFFVTSLGAPKWVVEKVNQYQGLVYHTVTEKKWAMKALQSGVHGFIAINNRAGGHAGGIAMEKLITDLLPLGVPVIAGGGLATKQDYDTALGLGHAGVQLGTRFIASQECTAHEDYKNWILKATEQDIALTNKISGVPVSIIVTPYIKKIGLKTNALVSYFLAHPKYKKYARMYLNYKTHKQLKKSLEQGSYYNEFFQAGKSVAGCHSILSCQDIVQNLVQ